MGMARPLVHVGGGVDRREEQAALREALQRGTATIHGDRILSPVVVLFGQHGYGHDN